MEGTVSTNYTLGSSCLIAGSVFRDLQGRFARLRFVDVNNDPALRHSTSAVPASINCNQGLAASGERPLLLAPEAVRNLGRLNPVLLPKPHPNALWTRISGDTGLQPAVKPMHGSPQCRAESRRRMADQMTCEDKEKRLDEILNCDDRAETPMHQLAWLRARRRQI